MFLMAQTFILEAFRFLGDSFIRLLYPAGFPNGSFSLPLPMRKENGRFRRFRFSLSFAPGDKPLRHRSYMYILFVSSCISSFQALRCILLPIIHTIIRLSAFPDSVTIGFLWLLYWSWTNTYPIPRYEIIPFFCLFYNRKANQSPIFNTIVMFFANIWFLLPAIDRPVTVKLFVI